MSGVGPRSSCKNLFRKLNILPVVCQYILSLMLFIADSQENYPTHAYVHGLDTRNKNNLYLPIVKVCLVFKKESHTLEQNYLINSQNIYRIIEMTRKVSKINYTSTSIFIPVTQLLNFQNTQLTRMILKYHYTFKTVQLSSKCFHINIMLFSQVYAIL